MFLLNSDIFIWDLLILLIMTLTFSGAIACWTWRRRHPNHTFQKLLIGLLGLLGFSGFLLITYASFIEPQMLFTTHHSISHPQADPLTIALISDMHLGPYKGKKYMQRVVNETNAAFPDLVLLTGDYVFGRNADLQDLAPLGALNPPLGVYAVLGNHDVGQHQSLLGKRYSGEDRGENIADMLESVGVTMLRNEEEIIYLTTGQIAITGIDDLWTGHSDLAAALDEVPRNVYTILLSHNPSVIDEKRSREADLIVSGHTHGGQMRLPGYGTIPDLPTSLGNSFDQGIFKIDSDTTLAITRGVGESSPRTRLFAWPEIMLLELLPST